MLKMLPTIKREKSQLSCSSFLLSSFLSSCRYASRAHQIEDDLMSTRFPSLPLSCSSSSSSLLLLLLSVLRLRWMMGEDERNEG